MGVWLSSKVGSAMVSFTDVLLVLLTLLLVGNLCLFLCSKRLQYHGEDHKIMQGITASNFLCIYIFLALSGLFEFFDILFIGLFIVMWLVSVGILRRIFRGRI
jgi:cobalamin synthase